MLGFGVSFADMNNDGRIDLLTANGHVNDLTPVYPYAMPAQLFLGTGGGRFEEVSATAGPPFAIDRVGRGLAVGDLDNDGRPDALLVDQSGPLVYFHNRSADRRALTLRLEGTESNRDAVGAVVTIEAGGLRQTAWRIGGGSYLAAGDPRLHFGLDDAPRVDRVEGRWPSGRIDRFTDLPADSAWHLREGDPRARPLPRLPRGREQERGDSPIPQSH